METLKKGSTVFLTDTKEIVDYRVHADRFCEEADWLKDRCFDQGRTTLKICKVEKIVTSGFVVLEGIPGLMMTCEKCCKMDVIVCPRCGEIIE